MRTTAAVSAVIVLIAIGATVAWTYQHNVAEEQVGLLARAAVTADQARQTALATIAGKVIESEIEEEDGRLVYCFEIRTSNGDVIEVEIDAMTGELIGTEKEDDDDDDDNGDDDDARR